jgi:TRAP-type C4-dicarboxylate transport system permease small subunit
MDKAWTIVSTIARVATWCAGAMLFIAAGVVTAEVLLRKGLGYLVGTGFVFSGSDEISAYLFAIATSWSMAHVLVTRGHVRIDALYGMFGPRTRAVLDLVALLMLGLFVAVLLERAWNVASTSFVEQIRSNTPLRIPLAIPQLLWFAGIVLFFVALVIAFLRSLRALWRGDLATAAATAGAPSLDEEIGSELQGLGIEHTATRSNRT